MRKDAVDEAERRKKKSGRSRSLIIARRALKRNRRERQVRTRRNVKLYISNRTKAIAMAKLLEHTIRSFFPDLREQLAGLSDPRVGSKYTIEELIFGAIVLFIMKEGSRNQMNNARHDRNLQNNFRKLFGYRLPHMDTVDRVLRVMPTEDLEKLRVCLVKVLIERKLLRGYHIGNTVHLVAVDGSGIMTANEEDEGTLKKESKNGTVTFTRHVLEAKIIIPGGFAISIATEWIATDQNDNGTKEDCEINAFKRLAEKIKKYFPKLRILILADGLYPSEPFFTTCKELDWSFCAVLKDKKLGSVWDKVDETLNASEAEGNVENLIVTGQGTIEWVNDITYRGIKISFIECIEGVEKERQRFVFVTDVPISRDIAQQLVAAGRSRWQLEDSFNTQKNRGYALQHKYSRVSFLATKNYYVLIQIAHMISQLVEYSQHVARLMDHGKETWQHLWELIINALIYIENDSTWEPTQRRTQYRYRFA